MGRLFWKFFVIFWLAQVVTAAGVGVAVWLTHSEREARPDAFRGGPPPPGLDAPDWPPPPGFFAPDRARRPPGSPGGAPPPHLSPPLLPIFAASLVSLLFAALLAWYFARPIRTLRAAFEAAAGGRLDTRVGAAMGTRHDELADLGQDFDRMAERLQCLLDAQRRLLHDVSHELRSPLARLQAAADLMRQQPERAAELLERIERDTGRMDKLVGELLRLARLDAGMAGQLDEEVDLREIVVDIAADAGFEADAKHCTIAVDLNGPVVARGSHELLYRAVENVVRNALRHSPEGGSVAIAARAVGDSLRVTVADNGPGVFDADLGAIFEPFFRSGAGRADGHGLGLAITRRVAQAHGGRVFAANRPTGGLLVTLELPQASACRIAA